MRCYRLLLMTVYLVMAYDHEKIFFVFSRDEKSLSNCIHSYLLNSNNSFYKEIETSVIAQLIAHKYTGTVRSRNELTRGARDSVHYLKTHKKKLFMYREVHQSFLNQIKKALYECADDESDVPKFVNEPRELADILDYILVEWPAPLQELITLKRGLLLLRSYAKDALLKFETALNFIGNREYFRKHIRDLFIHRAQFYFDRRNTGLSYIVHAYNVGEGLITYGNMSIFEARSNIKFSLRNSVLSPEDVYHFLNLHEANRPPYVDEDIFADYSAPNRMTSADLHIENRIDRFYRILFFVCELEISAKVTSIEDEIHTIPNTIMYRRINEMLHNDRIYHEILINERIGLNRYLERYSIRSQVEMGQVLSSSRIRQEYLNSLDLRYARSNIINCPSSIDYVPVPQFYFESKELRLLLDYILVDWDASLYFMVRDQNGRELLRRYATEARAALEHYVSDSMNRVLFRHMIRGSWMLRARYYFDGQRNDRFQYIPHRYILGRGLVTTVGLQLFYHRDSEEFNVRNPLVTDRSRVHSFLQSHPSNYEERDEEDIFQRYEVSGMSTAEYYFETHLDQFFRIIFFFNELNMRGFLSGDIRREPLPYGTISSVISVDLRAILSSNQAYGSYLLSLRTCLRREIFNNEPFKMQADSSLSSGPIQEENLIFYLSLLNETLNTENTKATSIFSRTTSKYDQLGKRYTVNDHQEESSCKRSRMTGFSGDQPEKFQSSYNHYGYVTCETEVMLERNSYALKDTLSDWRHSNNNNVYTPGQAHLINSSNIFT